MDEDVFFGGVGAQAAMVRERRLSARELTDAVLARIEGLDGALNAFTVVARDAARAEADARDEATTAGYAMGPLHGVPVAVKEEVDVAGQVTTFGGRANRTPARADAVLVRRLREAGAVVVGKTAMSEFGQWPFTESDMHGPTRNPWATSRSTGGSSGGSAAAVASGLVAAGIGGDGGGSLRIPASCCGLFGLKPQRGRVSTAPHPHRWWALGTAGTLTRTVRDSALVYDVIRGACDLDRFRAREPALSFVDALASQPTGLRIGWSTRAVTPGLRPHPEHVRAVERTAETLAGLGHAVDEVDPGYPDPTAAFVPQFLGGVRSEFDLVERPDLLERRTRQTAALGVWARRPVVEWAIRHGTGVAARANRVFGRCDLLLTPTIAHRPPQLGVLDGVGAVRASLRSMPMICYTALWNVAGNPAASVPAGFGADGLPLSVQLVGPPDDEATVLAVSAQLERAQPWSGRLPVVR